MFWIQLVFFVLTNLPGLINAVKELIEMIRERDPREKEELKHQLKDALVVAKTTGNKRPLRDLLQRLAAERTS